MLNPPIPPHFHLFWTGSPPGSRELTCLQSFRRHHPRWQLTIHGEGFSPAWNPVTDLAELKPLDWLTPEVRATFDRAAGPSLQSDVIRYAALDRWGGVWLDFDVVCLRPFDELRRFNGFVGLESFGVFGSSVIGAGPKNPVVRRALQLIPAWLVPADRLSIGPRMLTRAVLDCGSDWHVLEPEGFYPWRWSQLGQFPPAAELAGAFAVHLCHSLELADGPIWDQVLELLRSPAGGGGGHDE